eukprot:1225428-Prymnesium_polylepis.1
MAYFRRPLAPSPSIHVCPRLIELITRVLHMVSNSWTVPSASVRPIRPVRPVRPVRTRPGPSHPSVAHTGSFNRPSVLGSTGSWVCPTQVSYALEVTAAYHVAARPLHTFRHTSQARSQHPG